MLLAPLCGLLREDQSRFQKIVDLLGTTGDFFGVFHEEARDEEKERTNEENEDRVPVRVRDGYRYVCEADEGANTKS